MAEPPVRSRFPGHVLAYLTLSVLLAAGMVGRVWAAGGAESVQAASAVAGAGAFLPVEEIRPGMEGVGYTVVSGVEPSEFRAEILGVLRDVFPKVDLVVARLSGLGLERSNVVAGMSGSPVYVDSRLVGAVAYRMINFGHEAIAGIMPIATMLEMGTLGDDRPATVGTDPTRIRRVLETAATLLTGDGDVAGLETVLGGPAPGIRPIATPVSISGLRPGVVGAVTPLFESLGWTPTLGGVAAAGEDVEANFEPGGAVSMQIMRGDVNVSASGTVTYRDGDRVFALGHAFLQGGRVDFPMLPARVMTVLSSSADSQRLTVPGTEIVGAIRQDRLPAVMGVLGAMPDLVPVRLEIERTSGRETIAFELISDSILTPLYLYLGMVNAVQSIDQVYGEGSIELRAALYLDGDVEPLRFGNLFSSQNQAIVGLSSNLASIFSFLYGNAFEPVAIREVDLSVKMRDDRRSARIARVWYDRERVRPGEVVNVSVALEPYREPEVVETLSFRVPPSTPEGPLTLVVGDAEAVAREEQSFIHGSLEPRSLQHLVRLLNSLRRSDRIYLQVSRPDEGAFVNGEILPALPPSVLSMLTSERTIGDVVEIGSMVVAEETKQVDYVVSGSHRIELEVQRR